MKLDILFFGAHPDDVELACAGTIAKHVAQGKKVGIVDLTMGEMGTRGSAEKRMKEAAASAGLLGLAVRENLEMEDCFFENNKVHQLKIIPILRKYQPEIVVCNALHDRHPDHGRAGELVATACFVSGLRKVATSFEGVQQQEWRPKRVYHYIQDRFIQPDFVFDITPYWSKKMEAIEAFASQFYDPEAQEPETPISTQAFQEYIKARAVQFGRYINVRYAEGYTASHPVGVEDFFDLT